MAERADGAPTSVEAARNGSAAGGFRLGTNGPTLLVVLLVATAAFALGVLSKQPCREVAWGSHETQYRVGCYSDVPLLYVFRGFADHVTPYVEAASDGRYLEYPVLTGAVMAGASWLAGTEGSVSQRMVLFYDVTAIMLWLFALVTVAAVWATRPRGPTAALMVAASPALLLTATINWDLLAVAFTALAVWAWSRSQPLLVGLMLGLGAAAKFYPLLLLGPVLVLCLHELVRRRRSPGGPAPKAFSTRGPGATLLLVVGGTALSWLAVNLPLILGARRGWSEFYSFSQSRGIDFGSPWLASSFLGWWTVPGERANLVASGSFLLLCAAIGVLGLLAERPSFAQLAFLVVAAFAVTNKVYSPQYVLWLVPLAALARPRWGLFLLWQACEALYWIGVWRFLLDYGQATHYDGAIGLTAYAWTIWAHVLGTSVLAGAVVVDIVRGRPGGDDARPDGGPALPPHEARPGAPQLAPA